MWNSNVFQVPSCYWEEMSNKCPGIQIVPCSILTGSEEKLQACRQYGAHVLINYKQQNFAEEVLTATGNKGMGYFEKFDRADEQILCFPSGADVILDFVGASYWENHTNCVGVDGRIVLLGLVRANVYVNYMLFLPSFCPPYSPITIALLICMYS